MVAESRWPPVVALIVFMAFNVALRVWLPGQSALHVPWLMPVIEALLLVILLTSNPSQPSRPRQAPPPGATTLAKPVDLG